MRLSPSSLLRLSLAACLLLATKAGAEAPAQPLRVFAAASLTNAMSDIGAQWQQAGHAAPTMAFAASSSLSRQIDAGAPADLFFSADQGWMDRLQQSGKLAAGTRQDLLGNTLVLIAPKGRPFKVQMTPAFDIAKAFDGKLCTGEPGVVPVGIYARQSLEALGWWTALQPRIVGTDDVRNALAFVESGECPAGIVYATDAAISRKVEVVATFPDDSHQPIVYPVALIGTPGSEARAFLQYLQTSPDAAATFRRYGFTPLGK